MYLHCLMNLLYLSTHSLFFQSIGYNLKALKVRIVDMCVIFDLQRKYVT